MNSPPVRFVIVFIVTGAITLFLNSRFNGEALMDTSWERLGYALWPILILSMLLATPRDSSVWRQIKQFGVWVVVFALLIGLYSYRNELGSVKNRFVAAIMPQSGFEEQPGTMSFYRSSDGHFHIEAKVNGHPVRFLVDTGATDVVIAPHLARALGFDAARLVFSKTYHTANGKGRGAPVRLDSFEVGDLRLEGLPASINGASMNESLLGMRFFNRLYGFQVQGDILRISWVEP
ncbi:MAG: TIGR02281 family clan AA aspartic protease [Magnetococcales bacterium]|nr:TIGR02281 family clan AA aspartic protease [Magnetococcales bacterium]